MANTFSERIHAVREKLADWQVDGLLVTNTTNCRWLSGFTGSAVSLLISDNAAILATDSRYWDQAAAQAPDYELYKSLRRPQDTADFVHSAGVRFAGLEAHHVTLQQAAELESIESITWKHLDHPVEALRRCKSAAEVDAIRASAAITDAAMTGLPDMIHPEITERELAWQLERAMREAGADGMAFPPIVAFGTNSARPHHEPGDRRLRQGDIVLVDMGARLNGYNSDLTRTFLYDVGMDQQFEDVHEIVLNAQTAAIAGIRPGLDSQTAHNLAADVIAEAGYGEAFGHGLGHGLGLEIHEDPFMSAVRPPQLMEQGMVITVEPGIYLPDWGGIRIEDLLLITADGAEYISSTQKPRLLPPA